MEASEQPAKTLQAKTFTKDPVKAAADAAGFKSEQSATDAVPAGPAIPATLGVGFDQVIVAIKAGKTAQRIGWKAQMSLIGNKDKDGKIVGIAMKTSAGVSNAGLHNLDLLATDWKII